MQKSIIDSPSLIRIFNLHPQELRMILISGIYID